MTDQPTLITFDHGGAVIASRPVAIRLSGAEEVSREDVSQLPEKTRQALRRKPHGFTIKRDDEGRVVSVSPKTV